MTISTSPPRHSKAVAPQRVSGSIRRSTNLDVTWPNGMQAAARYSGSVRDLVTKRDLDHPSVVASERLEATVTPDMHIESIRSKPRHAELDQLVGKRCGTRFREVLSENLDEQFRCSSPLNLLLEDYIGAALVSGAAWLNWYPDSFDRLFGHLPLEKLLESREGVCIAHTPGFTAQNPETTRIEYDEAPAAGPHRPEDLYSWHPMELQQDVGFRRFRRIDVFLDDAIVIDSEFQDSASNPDGGRSAIHEYGLRVTLDPVSLCILSVEADPRVLPYPECPSATAYLTNLVGTPVIEISEEVNRSLRGVKGCTHLNDALRALVSIPGLLQYLR